MFCSAVIDILGLSEPQGWNNLRRHLRDEQVARVHELLSRLWPRDTDIAQLLPRPDQRVFRAVYMGLIDPRTIATSVVSLLAYFDEIVVLNPFPNPLYMKSEFSPTQSPSQHKSQMLKNVSALLTLQPFIEAGIIHFVPDPMDFNADFRRTVMEMAENRTVSWQPTADELRRGVALARDDAERAMLRLPAGVLRRLLRKSQPDITAVPHFQHHSSICGFGAPGGEGGMNNSTSERRSNRLSWRTRSIRCRVQLKRRTNFR